MTPRTKVVANVTDGKDERSYVEGGPVAVRSFIYPLSYSRSLVPPVSLPRLFCYSTFS